MDPIKHELERADYLLISFYWQTFLLNCTRKCFQWKRPIVGMSFVKIKLFILFAKTFNL